jgi:hypothetical protein
MHDQRTSFEELKPPEDFVIQEVRDWDDFLDSAPQEIDYYYYGLGAVNEPGVQPEMQREIKRWLKKQYQNDIEKLNQDLGTKFLSWEELRFSVEDFTERRTTGDYRGILAMFKEFKEKETPRLYRYYFSLDGSYQSKLRRKYTGGIAELNQDLKTGYKQWKDLHLTRTKPEGKAGELWEEFIRKDLNLQFIFVNDEALKSYHEFLKNKYHGDINFLNKVYGTEYADFEEIPLIKKVPSRGNILVDWAEFVESKAPVEYVSIKSAEFYYRDFLKERYKTIEFLNQAHGKRYESFDTVNIPAKQWEWALFQENQKHI